MNKHELTFIGCDANPGEADIILFGAPFDGTTSFRPGTRFGPMAARQESDGIETWSLYQQKDLEDYSICDIGDLVFPFGNVTKVIDTIRKQTQTILNADKIPFMIGGEHLVTLGSVQAVAEKYADLHIIHFDAHADLREDYLGEPLSHATVLRRCYDLLGDGRIHQFGIRSGTREEFAFAEAHTDCYPFNLVALPKVLEAIGDAPVYVTIDLDVLDPSIFPGTGTPEAGGVMWQDLMKAIMVLKKANIVACDINELSPHYDASGVSTAVAAKTIREMLLAVLA